MIGLTIQVKDSARGPLGALSEKMKNPGAGLAIAGRALGNRLKQHFREKDQIPNRLGGDRTHYWLRVGQSVNAPKPAGKNAVTVAITEPTFGHKVKGGTIVAKRAKFLTIPIHPWAHGRRASVLERTKNLKLFAVKGVLAGFVNKGDKKTKKLTFFYVLKKSINQKPDGTALPPVEEMGRVTQEAFNGWMAGI